MIASAMHRLRQSLGVIAPVTVIPTVIPACHRNPSHRNPSLSVLALELAQLVMIDPAAGIA